jgi:hypothetical protein
MEKIVINKELGKALLAFKSSDKQRGSLQNILVTETGAFCATDGKRLLLIEESKHHAQLAPGVYNVLSTGRDGKHLIFLCLERVETQFPDIKQVMKDNVPAIKEEDGKDLMAIIEQDNGNLRIYGQLYKLFKITGKAINPEMAIDFPDQEEFSIHTDETPAGAVYFKATGITALFMPFRTN